MCVWTFYRSTSSILPCGTSLIIAINQKGGSCIGFRNRCGYMSLRFIAAQSTVRTKIFTLEKIYYSIRSAPSAPTKSGMYPLAISCRCSTLQNPVLGHRKWSVFHHRPGTRFGSLHTLQSTLWRGCGGWKEKGETQRRPSRPARNPEGQISQSHIYGERQDTGSLRILVLPI